MEDTLAFLFQDIQRAQRQVESMLLNGSITQDEAEPIGLSLDVAENAISKVL